MIRLYDAQDRLICRGGNGNGDELSFDESSFTREALTEFIMKETQTLASLALEDLGWQQLGVEGNLDVMPANRQAIVQRARMFAIRDPICHQIIQLWTNYALGRGIDVTAQEDEMQKVIDEFMNLRKNRRLLSPTGQRLLSDRVLIDGELFLAFFGDAPIKMRILDPLHITEIISNPEDADDVWFYKRIFTDAKQITHTLYYQDWWAEDINTGKLTQPDHQKIEPEENVVVYHIKHNTIGRRGNSILTATLDWSRAHRKFMEARAAIEQAVARFAWKLTFKGGQSIFNSLRNQLQSGVVTSGGEGTETNPPPAPGATWLQNKGADLTPQKFETGARAAQTDGAMLLQTAGLGGGVFPHYFGAGEAFRLATAQAMELPMLKQFEAYQGFWHENYTNIFDFVSDKAGVSEENRFVDIDSPEIISKDVPELLGAMATLADKMPELAELDEFKKLVLMNLGVNNVAEVLEKLDQATTTEEVAAIPGLIKAIKQLKESIREA